MHCTYEQNLRFSFSLLGRSSFALASIPFGIGSSTAQDAKTAQGTAADLGRVPLRGVKLEARIP